MKQRNPQILVPSNFNPMLPQLDNNQNKTTAFTHNKNTLYASFNNTLKSSRHFGLLVALLYMINSVLLIYFNKAAFHNYNFNSPNLLTLFQTLCSLLLLTVCKYCGVLHYQSMNWRAIKRLTPLSLSFLLYMIFGMIAMKLISIPMYTTLRRTTVVLVMLIERLTQGKQSSVRIQLSVAVMVIGASIAGFRDLNFDLFAYIIVFIYNAFTALYLVLINQITTAEKQKPVNEALNKWDLMYYNSAITLPFLLVIITMTGEWKSFLASPHWSSVGFQSSIFGSSLLAFALNYSIFLNTEVNSALTQTVSGQSKDIVVVIAGFMLFDDAKVELFNVLGIVVGFTGSLLYGLVKLYPNFPKLSASQAQQTYVLVPTKS